MVDKAYKLLKEKGELGIEDIMLEFGVKQSTAYTILRVLKKLCEQDGSCDIKLKDRKKVLVYRKASRG